MPMIGYSARPGRSDGLLSIDSIENHYRRRNEIVHGHRFLDAETDGEGVMLEMEELARAFMQGLLTDQAMFEKVMLLQQERVEARRAKAEPKKPEPSRTKRARREQAT